MKRSPLHALHMLTQPAEDPTDAMQLGTAVHAAILQPGYFAETYLALPDVNKRTNVGKAALSTFMSANPGKHFLSEADLARCLAMREAALACHTVQRILEGTGDFELSGVWKDSTGLTCKLRADRVSYDFAGGTIIDIKTCGDASLGAFQRHLYDMGYHNQGAHYLAGMHALGRQVRHYSIIAIESKAPHGINVFRLQDEAITAAAKENRRLIIRIAECMKTGTWPGYSEGIVDIGLPRYAWEQLEGTN
jgi:hypothetical protein